MKQSLRGRRRTLTRRGTLTSEGTAVFPVPARTAPWSKADLTPVGEVMSRDVLCATADVPIESLVHLLVEHQVSGVPVVDAGGHLIGMVSKTDLAAREDEDQDQRGQVVGDIMMSFAFTVVESTSLAQCAALMAYEGVHRIPVVSMTGQVIGIISALDVARWLAQHDGYVLPDAGPAEPAA